MYQKKKDYYPKILNYASQSKSSRNSPVKVELAKIKSMTKGKENNVRNRNLQSEMGGFEKYKQNRLMDSFGFLTLNHHLLNSSINKNKWIYQEKKDNESPLDYIFKKQKKLTKRMKQAYFMSKSG